MITFRQSVRHAFVKGVALSLVLMLAFSLMPARSAFANGDVGAAATCTEVATLTELGRYVQAGGVSECTAPVPVHSMTLTFSIDFVPVNSGSKTCYGTASCMYALSATPKLPGGHIYCAQLQVTYVNSVSNTDMNCDWFWF